MANEEKQIEEIMLNAQVEAYTKSETITFNELKQIAKNFLLQITILMDQKYRNESFQNMVKDFYSDIAGASNVGFMQECFQLVQKFQHNVNRFLDRVVIFTFVFDDGTIGFYDEEYTEEIYSQLDNTGVKNGKGKIKTPDREKRIREFQDKKLKIMNDRAKDAAEKRGAVYKQAINRYNQIDMRYKGYNIKQVPTFWWRTTIWPYINWSIPISNTGYIAEAYANSIINNVNNFFNIRDLQLSLKILANSLNTNNIPAIIKGDIVFNKDGSFQFAVKKTGSSAAAIGQYIALAYYILIIKDLTPNQLKNKLKSLQHTGRGAKDILAKLLNISGIELEKRWKDLDLQVILG